MVNKEGMVGQGRLELPTSRLSVVRSNQLSYKPGLWLVEPFKKHSLLSANLDKRMVEIRRFELLTP